MGLENSHFIGFLYEDNRKILGLTDELDYPFLPLLINFNVFSLNLINSIKNGFLSYGFMLDSDDKNILEYLSNPGFSARIEQINVSINDQFRFFSTSIIDYINYT